MEVLAMAQKLTEVRCAHCARLLARMRGEYEIKCPKCKTMNRGRTSG